MSGDVVEWLAVLSLPQFRGFLTMAVPRNPMTIRPSHVNAYEFAVVSALRAQQLLAGCTPRLPGTHRATTMAQMEVAGGCVVRDGGDAAAGTRQSGWQR